MTGDQEWSSPTEHRHRAADTCANADGTCSGNGGCARPALSIDTQVAPGS